MKQVLRLGFILLVFAAVASGALSLVDIYTKPRIEAYEKAQQAAAREAVLPGAGFFKLGNSEAEFAYYTGYADEAGKTKVGYTYMYQTTGYSSTIVVIVGIDTLFTIKGIRITSQYETPGLGARISEIRHGEKEPWFQAQFRGKNALTTLVKADGGQIDAVTGATISSRAVATAVRLGAEKLKAILEGTSG